MTTYELQNLSTGKNQMRDFETDAEALEWAAKVAKVNSQLIRFREQITTFAGIQRKRANASLVSVISVAS